MQEQQATAGTVPAASIQPQVAGIEAGTRPKGDLRIRVKRGGSFWRKARLFLPDLYRSLRSW